MGLIMNYLYGKVLKICKLVSTYKQTYIMKKPLLFLFLFLAVSSFSFSQELNYSSMANSLIEEIETSSADEFDIYIILEDKVDLQDLDSSLRSQRASRSQRARTVTKALYQKAQESQAEILGELERDSGVKKESIKSYWLANIIFMRANKATLAKLSNDPRVQTIGIEGELMLIESEAESAAVVVPDEAEPGLDRINVRPLWDMGYTGYGQLALVADTGIDPTHLAYGHRYRGNTNGDTEAWYRWQDQQATPFQCGDHGSHVLGTVLGLDRLNRDTIGVAFDAQWLGSANLCGGGTESNIGTFQWSVNPDGDLETVEDMAGVINNSWWDPRVFGEDCNSVYVDVLEALEVAGVVVVFSGGNAGPDPATMTSPHNININLVNTFTVAALNGNRDDLPIALFSSRGPSTCEVEAGPLLIKPEVAAPGVDVRSAVLENGYGFKSGTSMAAPHVSGAILILRQAFPEVSAYEVKMALYNSCRDLGDPGEDNTFGMGIIDVLAAYNYLIDQGNTPVPPPSRDNDIMAYDLATDRFECNGVLTSTFVYFNNSADTLRSMDLRISIDGEVQESLSQTLSVSVAPFRLDTLVLDEISISLGGHEVAIEVSNPNGNIDERTLNNTIVKSVVISSNERLQTIEVENQVTCQGGNMLVKADYNGDGTIQWFDELIGGNLVAEGTQVVIQADEPTVVYGDILRSASIGKVVGSNETFDIRNDKEVGLQFDALFPMRITEFDFYSESNGNVFISVLNGRGDVVESEIINSDGSGWQTADVSIRMPEGFGYRMIYRDGIAQLGTSDNNLDFPYTINNIMTITGSTAPDNVPSVGYPYFFNMKVEFLDLCGRVPVEISAVETDSLPVAFFEMNTSLVDLNSNQEINFFNSSENGISFLWDFGDGTTSTEENPVHTYTEQGVYYPSLLVTGEDGCSDAFVQRIEVTATTSIFRPLELSNSFEVAPNPFSQRLNFRTETPIQVDRVEVYNSAGILARTLKIDSRINYHSTEIRDLVPGLYYVLIHTEQGVDTHKVIKQ